MKNKKLKLTMDDETAEQNHRKLWNWIAETGKHKSKSPMMRTINKFWFTDLLGPALLATVECDCFACGEAYGRSLKSMGTCRYCPIDWGKGKRCLETGSFYDKYRVAKTDAEKKKYALIIANLPWKRREAA